MKIETTRVTVQGRTEKGMKLMQRRHERGEMLESASRGTKRKEQESRRDMSGNRGETGAPH